MLLTIDIGNTMTGFQLYEGDTSKYSYRIASKKDMTDSEAISSFSLFLQSESIEKGLVEDAIISSVVPALTGVYQSLCKKLFQVEPKILGPRLKTGVKISTDNPKEVGADLIAAAAGAKQKYGAPCIVADFGTATKVFLLDKEGAFAGCTIGAGIGLQAKSLSTEASLLPEVSLQIPDKILGKNTNDSMNSSLTYGAAFSVRSLADGIEKEAGYPCKRILTGGLSKNVLPLLPEFTYDPSLVCDGLCYIYRRNQK